jgi:hypothetical protein
LKLLRKDPQKDPVDSSLLSHNLKPFFMNSTTTADNSNRNKKQEMVGVHGAAFFCLWLEVEKKNIREDITFQI